MEIKQVNLDKINDVIEIINDAKRLLGKNSLQWQQGYPNIDTMTNDINNKNLFGIYDNLNLIGIVCLVPGIEPSYVKIDGMWENVPSSKDITIHRIAVRENYHHQKIGDKLIKFSIEYAKKNNFKSIKIDTHKLNIPMQTLCLNNNFKFRGIITLLRDEEDNTRLAYELTL